LRGRWFWSLSLGKPHLYCLRTTFFVLTYLKLHFLPYFKAGKFHSLNIVTMKEEFFPLLCLGKPKTTVYD
jgi:hypothetical protein